MTKDFDKEFNEEFEKVIVNNIDEPIELENIIASTIKNGEKKLRIKTIIKASKVIASVFIVFIISLNLFPSFSTVASNLPIIGRLAEVMTFDKGLKNAIEEDLYQDINFEEIKEGITVSVKKVEGDYKSLYVEYEIKNMGDNSLEIKVKDKDGKEGVESIYGYSPYYFGENIVNSSFNIKFTKLVKEDLEKEEYLAGFVVNIDLEDEFNENNNEISFNNKHIETEVGDIEIKTIYPI